MCHALVIEDDYLAADYIAALAELAGATSTTIAHTEREAVAAALKLRPDIILCDARLEKGCGKAAASEIRAQLGDIPTLYVTGEPETCQANYSPAAIIAKPFDRDAFIAAFRKHAPLTGDRN